MRAVSVHGVLHGPRSMCWRLRCSCHDGWDGVLHIVWLHMLLLDSRLCTHRVYEPARKAPQFRFEHKVSGCPYLHVQNSDSETEKKAHYFTSWVRIFGPPAT